MVSLNKLKKYTRYKRYKREQMINQNYKAPYNSCLYRCYLTFYKLCFPKYYLQLMEQYKFKNEFKHDFEYVLKECRITDEEVDFFTIYEILQIIVDKRNNNDLMLSNPLKFCYKINVIDQILQDLQYKYKYHYSTSLEINDIVYQIYSKPYNKIEQLSIYKDYLIRPKEGYISLSP